MRRLFTLLLLLAGFHGMAQQYNNEWIDHSRTYYKVKIARAGIYRIPKTLLDANGIGNADVRNYEIFRNGQKVPFYSSVPTGALPAGGYIEFWGEQNDGKPDKALYRDPAYQHSDFYSLQTDTAIYFVSVNTNGSGVQIKDVVNNVAGSSLSPETEFLYTYGYYPVRSSGLLNAGFASPVGSLVYSSSYDRGEFFSSEEYGPTTLSAPLPGLYASSSATVTPVLKFGAVGNRLNARRVKVRVNSNEVADVQMDWFNDIISTANVPVSLLSSGTANLEFQNVTDIGDDRMVVSFAELTYMRTFDFANSKNFAFKLPAKASGYLLRISNFSHGGVPPVLYDLTNGERFVGDLSAPGFVQFALPGTATERKLVLSSQEASNISTVTEATARTFVNYQSAGNQGDFLIITNPILYTGSSGNNPVFDYKAYRESPAGGAHKVTIADVDELVDQFAFGIKRHPLSVHNYLRFARRFFTKAPAYCFLIGRGMTYLEYQRTTRRPATYPLGDQLNLVPTWGHPASDNLLSAEDIKIPVATTPIGRLSVVTGKEIEDYLEKLKEYELQQKNAPNTLAGRAWMKNVVHVTGSSEHYLGTVLCNYMNTYKQLIEDTLFGARVTTFCKESTNPVEQLTSERLSGLFAEGISFLTYFGHSSSTTLEFNIDNPQAYNNPGKYPVFFVNGCNAGNFFTYFAGRFTANETLSEKFVLAKQRGTIAFVASTHYGIVAYLHAFLEQLYQVMGSEDYDKSLGQTYSEALGRMYVTATSDEFYHRMHAEQIALNGDPSIHINGSLKPDYIIEDQSVLLNPSFISLAETRFKVKIKAINTGRAHPDSLNLEVKQTYPNGTTAVIYRTRIPGIRYADSLTLDVPIVASRDKGANKITVTVDADNEIDEVAENNNVVIKEFVIYEDEARPAFPYNYAIIDKPVQKLYASTANPLSVLKNYILEMDTTETFNSSMKVTKNLSSVGGVLEFDSQLTYKDSTVYYWRVAPVPAAGDDFRWANASFMYMKNTEGFNQSDFWQHRKSEGNRVFLDSATRTWRYGTRNNNVFVKNCIYQPVVCPEEGDFTVTVNDVTDIASACVGNSVMFNVFDSVTLKPWRNVDANGNNLFLYGSGSANCAPKRHYNFEFSYMNATSRKKAMDFMDIIPNGSLVVVRSIFYDPVQSLSSTWRGDTTLYGSNNSLYHKLLAEGFVDIDSVNSPRSWILVYKKGAGSSFIPQYRFGKGFSDQLKVSVDVKTPDTMGFITSPVFGPAKAWKTVKWNGESLETPSDDNPTVDVIGIDRAAHESILATLDKNTKEYDVSGIVADQYPYMMLRMRNVDSVKLTPYQLKSWRIIYSPVPEGAIAPNLYLSSKDTMELGEPIRFGVAFKNVSNTAFTDSILVRVTLTDKDNVTHNIPMKRVKALVSGDSVHVTLNVDTRPYSGLNTLNVYFNPDFTQPEHQMLNNFVFKNIFIKADNVQPTLDVTFDGVHILNNDIVSAKPHIQIKLSDDAKYLLLNDTTLSSVEIKYPDNSTRVYNFDGDTLRFIPATSSENNTAIIDFMPNFTNQKDPEGDEYELIVKAKDKTGNQVSNVAYRIRFKVIAKPMISNLLNYPNPFSTSTAFVFTLTGSELPQNLRIQILTVTGKIVREITMNELGLLHIGRNITEFKWDGTDQYGSKLANGVYLYRVVTSMNGKTMEKYKAKDDPTDKFFNNGYGKMYLMR